ncbi:spectrin alpha chain, non-erythrocytic 1-like [Bolinopsis microptera]|uniref:spectrin alpha chain, non-erythrocytic 1-like n=1 Tax=Bolinopsis microptera TaxID=2820187 RepID=UPI00307A9FEB
MTVDKDVGVKDRKEVQLIRNDVTGRWEDFRDLVESRRRELEELRLVKFILDEKLTEVECQLHDFKTILTGEDDTDTSNIMSRLERHNRVKGDIEKVADNVFTKVEEVEDILIIVIGLEQSKGVKLKALKESVTFLRDIKYIDRWLREHEEELLATETGEDLDQNEELIHEFEKLMEEFRVIRDKLDFVIVYSGQQFNPED